MYHKKMKPKHEGPFTITEVLGPVTYRLQLPTSWQIHNVFHATLLKPYRETETYGQNFTESPPELLEGEEVHEIKKHTQSPKKRTRLSILHQMGRLPYL